MAAKSLSTLVSEPQILKPNPSTPVVAEPQFGAQANPTPGIGDNVVPFPTPALGGLTGATTGSGTIGSLPAVSDPDGAYAQITRDEYNDYVTGYRDFELGLINQARTDTSLIDQARVDADSASALTRGIASRNASRYGASLTPAQLAEQERGLARAETTGKVQAVNDARIDQDTVNTSLLSGLINVGQGVNTTAQNQLSTSAQNASSLSQAYNSARTQSRNNTISTVAGLGSAAILALAF